MYVKVIRENGAPLLVDVKYQIQQFQCDNLALTMMGDIDFVHTKCACCERRLAVMLPDREPTDADIAYVKGGRGH